MAIPVEHKEAIICSGIEFMKSITECYGSDEGMKLWDSIADTLDTSVKGEIFFAMISGQYTTTVRAGGSVNDRVASIKTIRTYTGLGLKEAKDLSDEMQSGKTVTLKLQDPKQRVNAIRDLRHVGHIC
jgi:ribosomal protein L7/L12